MARGFDELSQGAYLPRRTIQDIPDPSTDTFIDRFKPLSSDPVGDYQKEQRFEMQRKMQEIEKGVPIYQPGTPRFADPTKVISMNGVALPDGFSLEPPKQQSKGVPLPEGFSIEKLTEQPAPVAPKASPLAGVPLSVDPAEQAREVAAIQTSRGTTGRAEGPVTDAISRFLPEVGAGIKAGFNRFLGDAGGKLQEPQNALPAALGGPVAPGIAAMRGGAALTRAISEGGILPGVDQAAAGKVVSESVKAAGSGVTPRTTLLANEDSIGQMAGMARTGSPEDLKALASLRRLVPAERQSEVQGALVQRLGAGDSGEFEAGTFVRNYGKISDRAKNILFGQGESGSLRHHLDSISEVTERAPTWRGPSMRTMAGTAAAASGVGAVTGIGAIAAPLAVLGTMVPVKVVAHALTSPALAASVAAWSRAYERAVRSGGNAAIVGFNLATKNLNNNLGTDVNPQEVLKGGE